MEKKLIRSYMIRFDQAVKNTTKTGEIEYE